MLSTLASALTGISCALSSSFCLFMRREDFNGFVTVVLGQLSSANDTSAARGAGATTHYAFPASETSQVKWDTKYAADGGLEIAKRFRKVSTSSPSYLPSVIFLFLILLFCFYHFSSFLFFSFFCSHSKKFWAIQRD